MQLRYGSVWAPCWLKRQGEGLSQTSEFMLQAHEVISEVTKHLNF